MPNLEKGVLKMKRVLALALAMSMALSLTACGPKSDGGPEDNPDGIILESNKA